MPAGIVTEDIVLKEHLLPGAYHTVRQYALEIAECYFFREPLYELQCLGKRAQSQSAHSQERFLTRGQILGIPQDFRKQHTANL